MPRAIAGAHAAGRHSDGSPPIIDSRSLNVNGLRDAEPYTGSVRPQSVIDPVVVDALVRQREQERSSPLARLTDREREVLQRMAEGLTNATIAEQLHLSASAVEKHVAAIFAKLDLLPETPVHRRVAAVRTLLHGS